MLAKQHQNMTCAKDRLHPSEGADDPWRMSLFGDVLFSAPRLATSSHQFICLDNDDCFQLPLSFLNTAMSSRQFNCLDNDDDSFQFIDSSE